VRVTNRAQTQGAVRVPGWTRTVEYRTPRPERGATLDSKRHESRW